MMPTLPKLSFPKKDFRIKNIENKWFIFDELSFKYRLLTPEEWVRQNLSSYLIEDLNYPKTLCVHEFSFNLFKTKKRADFILFSPQKKALVLAECKAAHIAIKQEVMSQTMRYNMALGAPYLILSNGLLNYCFLIDLKTQKIQPLNEIPNYRELKPAF